MTSGQASQADAVGPVTQAAVAGSTQGDRLTESAAKSTTVTSTSEHSGTALEWVKALGMPLVTVLITVVGGFVLNSVSKTREAKESNERLYAELLTQREESDAQIRKEMFSLVVNRFLADPEGDNWHSKVLQLELLASNFNQSLDLAPLFKDLARELRQGADPVAADSADLRRRLDLTAANVIFKQVNTLARRGYSKETVVPLGGWETFFGKPVIDVSIPMDRLIPSIEQAPNNKDDKVHFAVEIIGVSMERHEVDVRLRVDFPDSTEGDVDRHFWVGQYDFPMLDNTQLPYGLRTSVVMTEFFVPESEVDRDTNSFTKIHLVVFPAASASFKERQDYDDILLDLLRAKARAAANAPETR
jgi:hypothetical protein